MYHKKSHLKLNIVSQSLHLKVWHGVNLPPRVLSAYQVYVQLGVRRDWCWDPRWVASCPPSTTVCWQLITRAMVLVTVLFCWFHCLDYLSGQGFLCSRIALTCCVLREICSAVQSFSPKSVHSTSHFYVTMQSTSSLLLWFASLILFVPGIEFKVSHC